MDNVLTSHPLADIFPPMTAEEFEALKADIETYGLFEPIVLYEGQILDGRHRAAACDELEIEPVAIEYDGDDPAGFVLSKNLKRRHLKTEQRAMIGARLARLRLGSNQHQAPSREGGTAVSAEQAAKALNVGHASIERARQVLDQGIPELIAECDAGQIPISIAAKIARLEPQKQQEIMTGPAADAPASLRPHPRPEPTELADYLDAARMSLKVINALDIVRGLPEPREVADSFQWQTHYTADDFRGAGEWLCAFADRLENGGRREAS